MDYKCAIKHGQRYKSRIFLERYRNHLGGYGPFETGAATPATTWSFVTYEIKSYLTVPKSSSNIKVMRSKNEHKEIAGDSYRELRLLEEVSLEPNSSQRKLAKRLGVALGVTNILMRSLGKKGYIRIVQVKWQSWIYTLTPTGIARKVQLTFAYVENFLGHYKRIREILHESLDTLAFDTCSSVAIYGQSELRELIFIILRDLGITNITIIDPRPSGMTFLGMPILSFKCMSVEDYSKIIVAFPTDMQIRCQQLLDVGANPKQIVPLLHDASIVTSMLEGAES